MVLEGNARQVRFVHKDQIRAPTSETGVDQPAGAISDPVEEASAKDPTSEKASIFTRIESMEVRGEFDSSSVDVAGRASKRPAVSGSEPRRVLVFGKFAHRMLCLEFPRSDSPDMDMMEHMQAELQVPSKL